MIGRHKGAMLLSDQVATFAGSLSTFCQTRSPSGELGPENHTYLR
jgi:hypothetical protein